MRNNSVKVFRIWTSGSGGDPFYRYFISAHWQPFCSAERNHLCNFDKGHYEEQFCDQWLGKR